MKPEHDTRSYLNWDSGKPLMGLGVSKPPDAVSQTKKIAITQS